MFSHTTLGVSDFERAMRFYRPIMERLGHRLRFADAAKPWAGWMPGDADRPLFLIRQPFDGRQAAPGNGSMVALLATTREAVDDCYTTALELGGTCEGPPGLRPEYHPHYYGAYVRDPDGNKLCFVCHTAPA